MGKKYENGIWYNTDSKGNITTPTQSRAQSVDASGNVTVHYGNGSEITHYTDGTTKQTKVSNKESVSGGGSSGSTSPATPAVAPKYGEAGFQIDGHLIGGGTDLMTAMENGWGNKDWYVLDEYGEPIDYSDPATRKKTTTTGIITGGSGGIGGSSNIAPSSVYVTPEYKEKYAKEINELNDLLEDYGAFSFNPEDDPAYQAYKKTYEAAGKNALDDTLARVASKTGGMASSYAIAAAQNEYNRYMNALAGKIPELEQTARAMYDSDYNKLLDQKKKYEQLEADNYKAFLDNDAEKYAAYMKQNQAVDNSETLLKGFLTAVENGYDGKYEDWLEEYGLGGNSAGGETIPNVEDNRNVPNSTVLDDYKFGPSGNNDSDYSEALGNYAEIREKADELYATQGAKSALDYIKRAYSLGALVLNDYSRLRTKYST